MADRSIVSRA
ncbi:unnamed protein product [Lathyrus sativus]|nr:unnamed protein product [Lathyrus sativus]